MQINVIHGGIDAFNALVYSNQHPANATYFQNQIENISSTLTGIGATFFAEARNIYDQVNSSEVMRLARAASQNVKSLFQPNTVRSLFDIHAMQTAPIVMQRWIMANPVVREQYHNQRLDGYSETYVDNAPNKIGENHYDYRRVMDGVVVENENGWVAKHYPDDLYEGDRKLIHDEKCDILSTWEIIELFVAAGDKDPTSPYNASL